MHSNPAKTQFGTLNTHGQDLNPAKTHRLPTKVTHLVSGPTETPILVVSSQKELSKETK